jgi:hypothetical protein
VEENCVRGFGAGVPRTRVALWVVSSVVIKRQGEYEEIKEGGYSSWETLLTLKVQKLKGRLWDACRSETIANLLFVKLPFLRRGIAGGIEKKLCLESTTVKDGEFGRGRWWVAFYSRQPDTVFANSLDPNVLDVRLDV